MPHVNPQLRTSERGSALVVAILVTVILTLLGVSFLLMAETENRIAENERLGAQALYFGEAATQQVKRWFDRPDSALNLVNPPLAAVDRTLREIDDDGDPATAAQPQDGAAWPRYKQGVDLDANGVDDLFQKPYRADLPNTLLGTEDGPDMRIDEEASAAAANFLESLSEALLANYPAGDAGIRARVRRIDVYAPPYVNIGGNWTRYGMGTVKVLARIYRVEGAEETVLAERMIKAVLNETPYYGPFGPLHSCDELGTGGDFSVRWGVTSIVQEADLTNNMKETPASLARELSTTPRVDRLWGWSNPPDFVAYKTALEAGGMLIQDPWSRVMSGGPLLNMAPGTPNPAGDQPWPFPWAVGTPLGDQDYEPSVHSGGTTGVLSHVMQNQPSVTCPDFDYDTWKTIATAGTSDVHYYVWTNGDEFRENGSGPEDSFRNLTDTKTGLFFFDTTDARAPHDDDADGEYDNLTPEIEIQGGTYGVRGFLYVNSENFATMGLGGREALYQAPGEPFLDLNEDGKWNVGEAFVNLQYPAALDGNYQALQDAGEVRNSRGPVIAGEASIWGVLYTNGHFEATGNGWYYGSVITKLGVGDVGPAAGTPNIYFDEGIKENWPPAGWDLPRVVITRWETDL